MRFTLISRLPMRQLRLYANGWPTSASLTTVSSTRTIKAGYDLPFTINMISNADCLTKLALDVTGQEIEDLLKTEFYEHDHTLKSGKMAVGCDEYHVPAHIQEHIGMAY